MGVYVALLLQDLSCMPRGADVTSALVMSITLTPALSNTLAKAASQALAAEDMIICLS
jgi:hypothetical protein